MLLCRWHIEGEITHDWKKLAERKEKQLRKLSDTYKGQLDKVMLSRTMQSFILHVHACCVHLHLHLHFHLHAAFIFCAPLLVTCALTALYYHGSIKRQHLRVTLCPIDLGSLASHSVDAKRCGLSFSFLYAVECLLL